MKYYFWFIFLFFQIKGFAQCLTSFQKIAPEAELSPYPHGFAESIDIRGDVAVVGITNSDSLQFDGGMVYVYEYQNGQWSKIAVLSPSEPQPTMNFGINVKITENYIFVSSHMTFPLDDRANYNTTGVDPGSVFIYKKPSTGWTSMTESVKLDFRRDAGIWGKFQVSEQEHVICYYSDDYLFFIARDSTEWRESDNFTSAIHSHERIQSVYMNNDVLAYSTTTNSNEGMVHLKRALNKWQDFDALQNLERQSNHYYHYGQEIILKDNHLLVSTKSANTDSVFLYSTLDNWASVEKEIVLTSQNSLTNYWGIFHPKNLFMNDSLIIVGRNHNFINGALSVYKKPTTGWEDNTEDRIIDFPEFKFGTFSGAFAYAPSHLVASGEFTDYPNTNGKSLLFYSITDDPPQLVDIQTHKEMNSTGKDFGRNGIIHEDILAITSYNNDRALLKKGAVHLYKKNANNSWEVVNIISSDGPLNEFTEFGSSIAFYEDFLVIGAPNYKEDGFSVPTGRVFVYKKAGDWTNVIKIAELRPSNWEEEQNQESGINLNFGHEIAIDGNTIVVGAPGKDLQTMDHGMVYVFEKPGDQDWASSFETAKLYSNQAIEYTRIGLSFAVQDNCIIAPHHWAPYREGSGLISVFQRPITGWKDTTDTYVHNVASAGARAYDKGEIVVDGDMLYVGDPNYRSYEENHFGRILIYKKSAVNWSEIETVNTLNYHHVKKVYNYPIEHRPGKVEGFGKSFKVIDNILVAGLHFMNGRYGFDDVRKGKVPVFQALDSKWENVIELLTLEGDNYKTTDGFGYQVDATKDDFVICAPEDDSKTGFYSGTVYAVPMPPTVKLMGPICIDEGPVNLVAYPADGVWAGNGIVDEKENIFHPEIAGVGIHELTYTTPNCYYEGKMRITVKGKEKPSFKHPTKMDLCENDSILLEVDSVYQGMHRWSYLADTATNAIILEDKNPSVYAMHPGKYWVELYNLLCPVISDTITVHYVPNVIHIDSLPIICDPEEKIELKVAPSGGRWTSNAVDASHIITPSMLHAGQNKLIYEFSASSTCRYYDTLSVVYDPLLQDTLMIESYEICVENPNPIYLEQYPGTNYVLQKFNDSNQTSNQDISFSPFTIDEEGTYQILINKHSCFASSSEFEVSYYQDSVFFPNVVTANQDLINDHFDIYVENAQYKKLAIYNRWGKLIFESDDYKGNWPGKDYPSGTYFYECIYNTVCNPNATIIKGWIELLN
jgi:gliding motility-associated-like protein